MTVGMSLKGPTVVAGDDTKAELHYWVDEAATAIDAWSLAWAAAPAKYRGLYKSEARVSPHGEGDGTLWEAQVSYQARKPKEDGDWEINLEIGTASAKITQALRTRSVYVRNAGLQLGLAPDLKGAINVGLDGTVEGTDVLVPKVGFGLSLWLAQDDWSIDWVRRVMQLTARTNSGPFFGFAKGEVLLESATSKYESSKPLVKVDLKFSVSANVTDLKIANDEIGPIDKRGHEYVSVYYEQKKDENAKKLVIQPIAAYVLELYREGNFEELGIET